MIRKFPPTRWQKVYATSTTQSSWPAIAPTATLPTAENVFTPSGTRIIMSVFSDAGLLGGGSAGNIRVVGWRKLGTIYYPETVILGTTASFTAVTAPLAGDGVEISASDAFVAAVSQAGGNADESQRSDSVGPLGPGSGYQMGFLVVAHNGPLRIQVDVKLLGFGTRTNAVVAFI